MKRTLLAVLAAALLGPAVAVAQATSSQFFDLERLSLDPSAVSSMVVGTGEVRPVGQSRLSLAGHYENRPLVLLDDGTGRGGGLLGSGTRVDDVVRHRLTGHLGVSVQPTPSLEVNVRIPYVAWQESGPGVSGLATDGLGSPSIGLRYQLQQQGAGAPLNVAIAGEALLPVGDTDALAGTEQWAFTPRVELGHRFDGFVIGGQAGALIRRHTTDFGGDYGKLRSEAQFGVVGATTGAPLRGELSVRGSIGPSIERNVEVLAGARYAILTDWEAFALAGPGFLEAPGTPRFRGVVGVAWVPPAPKKAAAPAPAAVAKPADPCAPGMAHAPEQCPALDDDKDGVANQDDACPLVAGIPEERGCPAKDTDGDGIPDHKDRCPTVPGVADNAGCPAAKAKLNVETKKIDILEKVYFDTGKATIQGRSFPLLDEVAQVLKDNPQITKVLVEGHTDDTGAADFNTYLSAERAKAVKAYLVGKGVDAGRLDSKGFGSTKPVGDNRTKEGREQNRRVEFTIP